MRKYLLTPGPTMIPEDVSLQTANPVIHHRTEEFGNLLRNVVDKMKKVFITQNDLFVLTSSGTGGMEMAVANLISPKDKVIVVSIGVFGHRWSKILKTFGADVSMIDCKWGEALNIEEVKARINEIKGLKAVFTTLTETSTGTVNPIKDLGNVMKGTDAILVVDAISGIAVDELWTDKWGCDLVIAGSQKGLMMPPGLAFVSVSKKAWKLIENNKSPRFYWDLLAYRDYFKKGQTPYTPAVTLLFAASRSLDMILQEGLDNIWLRHRRLSEACRGGVKKLGLELFSSSPSCGVTAVKVPPEIGDGTKINNLMKDKYGVIIAGGQQNLKGKIFRFAHMGNIGSLEITIGLSALEMVLQELKYDVPLGKGVEEAERVLLGM